jgi:hypothetical protein
MTPPAIACVARERVVREAAEPGCLAGALKVMLVFRRDPEVPAERFSERWLAGENPLLMPHSQPPLRLTRQAVIEGETPGPFSGVECTWWNDFAEFRGAWRQREQENGRGLVDGGWLRGLLVREEIVVPPPLSH